MGRNGLGWRIQRLYLVHRQLGMTAGKRSFTRWFLDELDEDQADVPQSTLYRWVESGAPDERSAVVETTITRLVHEASLEVGKLMAQLESVE